MAGERLTISSFYLEENGDLKFVIQDLDTKSYFGFTCDSILNGCSYQIDEETKKITKTHLVFSVKSHS